MNRAGLGLDNRGGTRHNGWSERAATSTRPAWNELDDEDDW